MDPVQTGAVCSGFTLFAFILNSSVMLGNYLQQTTSADNIFRCSFFLGPLRVKLLIELHLEFLSLKGGCTSSSESTLVKMPHCWKSHVAAKKVLLIRLLGFVFFLPEKTFCGYQYISKEPSNE